MGFEVHKFSVDKELQHRKSNIMFESGYSYVSSKTRRHSAMCSMKLSTEIAFSLKWNLIFLQALLKML